MDLLNLLIELASTPAHTGELNDLLLNQPSDIQQAFQTHNPALLRQQLISDGRKEIFADERTVVQVYCAD
jgi:hypothetical protein